MVNIDSYKKKLSNSFTSNDEFRHKQSNHKTDESMKIGQSVEFFERVEYYFRKGQILF